MIAVNYTNIRANLKTYMDKTREDFETIVITSKNGNVVMISEEEYNNLMENMFIMNNPAMRAHLDHSIQQLINGETVLKTLDDLKKEETDG